VKEKERESVRERGKKRKRGKRGSRERQTGLKKGIRKEEK
jgi:hypothetical protein